MAEGLTERIEVSRVRKHIILAIFLSLVLIPYIVFARVSGVCSNCHTMHFTQDGVSEEPSQSLLVDSCVGCHSATDGTTWKDPITGAPIVYNAEEPSYNTQKGLAGGNFYWAAQKGHDNKGHNVYGISGQDPNLSYAPGDQFEGGVANCNCHISLATDPSTTEYPSGCEGCHEPSHHDDNGWYRFLGHPKEVMGDDTEKYVEGIEDENWEFSPTSSHNVYKGHDEISSPTSWGNRLGVTHTISAFCCGCHNKFHDMDSGSGWERHPSDAIIPDSGEYAAYTSYNPLAPVAKLNPTESDKTNYTVEPGSDFVMCLSCHRPHGSPYPDMLRWDYLNGCQAGTSDPDCGCFVCHTEKGGS
ncbi:MAG: hypothetical protein DRP41_06020 [Thermodesulfobacteriota bacterium]|nr:MAG: hypothetical protein DRP41_06020 [Thermodesulfobacteriota bacterium]